MHPHHRTSVKSPSLYFPLSLFLPSSPQPPCYCTRPQYEKGNSAIESILSRSAWGVGGYIRATHIQNIHVVSSLTVESPLTFCAANLHKECLCLSPFILSPSIYASSLFLVSFPCITYIPPLFTPRPSLVLPGLEDLGLSLSPATISRA